jgi:carboxypeptidase Q
MRSEELEHSQLMHTLHILTDVYGPRLTGTPNHEAAAKWAVQQMTEEGMKNASRTVGRCGRGNEW